MIGLIGSEVDMYIYIFFQARFKVKDISDPIEVSHFFSFIPIDLFLKHVRHYCGIIRL